MSDSSFPDSNIKVKIEYKIRPDVTLTRNLELTPEMKLVIKQADVTLFDETKQQEIPLTENSEFYSNFLDEMYTIWTIGRGRFVPQ